MNNYEVIDRKFVKFVNGKSIFRVVVLADSEEDIPEPLDEWAPGSVCMIMITDDFGCKILNTQGVWNDV